MRRHSNEIPAQDSGTFNLSISDLMAGLLAIFILTLAYCILSFNKSKDDYTNNNQLRQEMVSSIGKELNRMEIRVEIDEKRGILRIPEETLNFHPGSAEVPNKATVQRIGAVLLRTLKSEEYIDKVETVFIEGHTDSDPIYGGRYASNWELSTQRAINTWNVMRSKGVYGYNNQELSELRNHVTIINSNGQIDKSSELMFSCSGYADTRPIPNTRNDAAGKKRNRRIDIRFTMAPPAPDASEHKNDSSN